MVWKGPMYASAAVAWTWHRVRGATGRRFRTASTAGQCTNARPVGTPIRSATAASVSVLATHHLDHLDGSDHKLLIFADSRQEVAHQAGYSADRHRAFAVRHLIEAEVREAGPAGLALEDIPQRLLDGFRWLRLITKAPTRSEQEKWLQVFSYEAAT